MGSRTIHYVICDQCGREVCTESVGVRVPHNWFWLLPWDGGGVHLCSLDCLHIWLAEYEERVGEATGHRA